MVKSCDLAAIQIPDILDHKQAFSVRFLDHHLNTELKSTSWILDLYPVFRWLLYYLNFIDLKSLIISKYNGHSNYYEIVDKIDLFKNLNSGPSRDSSWPAFCLSRRWSLWWVILILISWKMTGTSHNSTIIAFAMTSLHLKNRRKVWVCKIIIRINLRGCRKPPFCPTCSIFLGILTGAMAVCCHKIDLWLF